MGGDGVKGVDGGYRFLAICENHFITVHVNLVHNPSTNKSITKLYMPLNIFFFTFKTNVIVLCKILFLFLKLEMQKKRKLHNSVFNIIQSSLDLLNNQKKTTKKFDNVNLDKYIFQAPYVFLKEYIFFYYKRLRSKR